MNHIDPNILLPCDGIALTLVAEALANYYRVKKSIESHGEIYEAIDSNGTRVFYMSPEVEILSLYKDMLYTGLAEFYLTPRSRKELLENY